MGRVRAGGKRRTIKKWPPPLWRGLFLFCLVVDERVVHAEFFAVDTGGDTCAVEVLFLCVLANLEELGGGMSTPTSSPLWVSAWAYERSRNGKW